MLGIISACIHGRCWTCKLHFIPADCLLFLLFNRWHYLMHSQFMKHCTQQSMLKVYLHFQSRKQSVYTGYRPKRKISMRSRRRSIWVSVSGHAFGKVQVFVSRSIPKAIPTNAAVVLVSRGGRIFPLNSDLARNRKAQKTVERH